MRLIIDGRRLTARRTGVGRYLEALLGAWSISGPPLPTGRVVLADPSARASLPVVNGLEYVVAGPRHPGIAWEVWGLGRTLRPGDLLFAPANLTPPNWSGPTVLVLHDLIQEVIPESFPWHVRAWYGRRYRRAARGADLVLVPSDATAADAVRLYGVDPARIRVVPPGLDPEFRPRSPQETAEVRTRLGFPDRGRMILFVGKRSRRRHVPDVLAAFRLHRRRHPDDRLVFVGPSDPAVPPHDPEQGILVLGYLETASLAALLGEALAVVYPSDYEGFGLPVIEAMACGCPVLTRRDSALIESGGEAAWFLPSFDPETIAEALEAVSEPSARAEIVRRGLRHAARFRREVFADAVTHAIRSVADAAERGERPAPPRR